MKRAAVTIGLTTLGVAALITRVAPAQENDTERFAYGVASDGTVSDSDVTESPPDSDAGERPPSRPKPHSFGVHLGVRFTNISHAGYDPYSESNALAQSSIAASYSPWRTLPISVYLHGEWNAGSSRAYARGDATRISVHRLALGLEGRWSPMSRFYLFAKAMPSALRVDGEIQDSSLNATLEAGAWTWGLDASGGAALRLGSAGRAFDPAATFWLMMDWGYAFAGEAPMVYRPASEEDDPRKFGDITLPSIRPGGFVTRIGAAVTF